MKLNISLYIESGDWKTVFALLSKKEQKIMVGLARSNNSASIAAIASNSLLDKAGAREQIKNLCAAELLSCKSRKARHAPVYSIKSSELEKYCLTVDPVKLWEGSDNEISNHLYCWLSQQLKTMEHLGLICGDGHDMAQKLSAEVLKDLIQRKVIPDNHA
jgi:hypothetical protein